MNCCMRSLSPSNAADMLANMVSPPIAGTSLATRIVAFGGSLRNVSSECQTSVRNGGLVSSLRNLISTETSLSFGANGCTVSSPNRRPKSIRFSELMSWLRKMSSSFSASAFSIASRCSSEIGLAKIDAGDLGPEVGADPRDRQTPCSATMGRPWKLSIGLFMMSNSLCKPRNVLAHRDPDSASGGHAAQRVGYPRTSRWKHQRILLLSYFIITIWNVTRCLGMTASNEI